MNTEIDSTINVGLTRKARVLLLCILILGASIEVLTRIFGRVLPTIIDESISFVGLGLMVVSVILIVKRAGSRPLVVVCMGVTAICVMSAQGARLLAKVPIADGRYLVDNSTYTYSVLLDLFDGLAPMVLVLGFFLMIFQLNHSHKLLAEQTARLKHEAEDRARAEEALRKSESSLRDAQALAQVGHWTLDPHTEETTGSEEFFRIFNLNRGKTSPRAILDLVHPDDKALCEESLKRGIRYGEAWEIEHRLVCQDGTHKHIQSIGEAVKDVEGNVIELVGTVQDITERKLAEEKTIRFNRVLEGSLNEIYVFDAETLHFIEVNQGARNNLGYTMEEFSALTPLDIKPEYTLEQFEQRIEPLRMGIQDKVEFTTMHQRKDGTTYPAEVHLQLFTDGEPVFVAFILDITKRRWAEDERNQLETQMQQTQRLESLGIMAGGIAHDFNNILAIVLGYTEITLEKTLPDDFRYKHLQGIQTAARRAAELTDQMLAYSGKGALAIENMNLSGLVQEMGQLLEVSHTKKAIVEYSFDEDILAIKGDPSQLRQVVMNLITNASEAIGDVGGVISVKTGVTDITQAHLATTYANDKLPEGQYVYLEVADTGCGMNKDEQRQIFDPFFTTKFTGRGLGMAAVLGIVRAHKGAIHIKSKVQVGTTVKVLFPAVNEPVKSIGRDTPLAEEWTAHGTILVVDDEPQVRMVIKIVLERKGFTVLTAENGHEAITVFQEKNDEIVCVLLDLTMPHMGGEETFIELHKIRNDVPVVLVSGYNKEQLNESLEDLGFAGFLKKPVSTEMLLTKVHAVLSDSKNA